MRMKMIVFFAALFFSINIYAQNIYSVKIEAPPDYSPALPVFSMGTAFNPAGETVEADAVSMIFNGQRVVPVMGEIHFSRLPASQWRSELLKMKEGGINIVATYVFWIHHEEIKGQYIWQEERNLRHFAEICRELDMKLMLRIGPWAHGEARNGGFPDWLATGGIPLRPNQS